MPNYCDEMRIANIAEGIKAISEGKANRDLKDEVLAACKLIDISNNYTK